MLSTLCRFWWSGNARALQREQTAGLRNPAGVFLLVLLALAPARMFADGRFDLTGPKVDVRVTRAGMSLPIAAVPNLQVGDRLWVHPDLPATQSVRYLMLVIFLRGTTNPPPEKWFIRINTWDKKVREEGAEVTVPDGAQQAIMFLAPVTGGDFGTMRSAVQGRPGVFVRAANDLDLAGFEQARIEKYVASMHEVPTAQLSDPKALQEHSNLIAATLALKPNGDCIKLPPDQQYTCLTQSGSQSVLDDGHGQSIVSALSSGPGSDFINQASYTQLAGAGMYSAYVGAVVDLVRLLGSLHTAQYQYIPAIAFPEGDALNLRLNVAPSFHNPKSVIVIGLPSVQKTSAPPLRPTDAKHISCLLEPNLILPVEGAPLVFSTGFAHDMVLHINYPKGSPQTPNLPQDLPLTSDAYKGGLVVGAAVERRALPIENVTLPLAPEAPDASGRGSATEPAKMASLPASDPSWKGLTGTVEGFWGFDTFKGPTLPLQNVPGANWKLITEEPLIAGKEQKITLGSTGTACIDSIAIDKSPAAPEPVIWKQGSESNTIEVSLKLSPPVSSDPRTYQLSIRQFGAARPEAVSLVTYSAPAKLTALIYHVGDRTAELTGASLDQVKELHLGEAVFSPGADPEKQNAAIVGDGEQATGSPDVSIRLKLASNAKPPSAMPGETMTAQVLLRDGRVLPVRATIEAARPAVRLISRAIIPPAQPTANLALSIRLGSPDDLPLSDTVMFALKFTQPFARSARVEVASEDGSMHAMLGLENASLILEDPRTVLARLEPLKSFGPSAFGPIHLRAITPDGSAGDWIPLTTLVRLPTITGVSCPLPGGVAQASAVAPSLSGFPGKSYGSKEAESVTQATAPAEAAGTAASSIPASIGSGAATTSVNVPAPDSQGKASESPASERSGSDSPGVSGAVSPGSSTAPATTAATASGRTGDATPVAVGSLTSCTISGSDLYLLDSVSADPSFGTAVHVPDGFVDTTLDVPTPVNGLLYLRLRDDPATTDTLSVPAATPETTRRAEHVHGKH